MSNANAQPAAKQKFTATCLGHRVVIEAASRPEAREIAIKQMNIRPTHRDWLQVDDGTPFGEPPVQTADA